MDYSLLFAILLYLNVFYFGLFASVEFFLLLFKAYNVSLYTSSSLINELFALTFLVVVESVRLMWGNEHFGSTVKGFDRKLNEVFRILVLTVPSMYTVTYFTMWQTVVTKLDAALGGLMLLLQFLQFVSAFLHIVPRGLDWKEGIRRILD